MNRRSFLKDSIGALLFAGLSSNKALAQIVETLTPESPKVLLYLIQNKKGQWKIRGTKWIDIAKSKLDINKVNIETFKAIEIVSNEFANERKNQLWKIHNCSGEKGAPLNVEKSKQNAYKAHKSQKMINYLNSEDWKKNWSLGKIRGGQICGKKLGKRNVETGWIEKIRPKDFSKNILNYSDEDLLKHKRMGGKAASIINLNSGQVAMAQKLAAKSRRKRVKCLSTGIEYESLKDCALKNNLYYPSFKNMMNNNSGRKNKTTFVYI